MYLRHMEAHSYVYGHKATEYGYVASYNYTQRLHSKIEKLYVLNVVELISSIRGYCTIMSVGLTVLGRIN